ncbi:site-2 protease family protein [Halobacterium salinarum]|uniref:site-2 protease family protein n=1 Tax=Halobacterium TaxID=2239 RepID=UPI0019669435|nr:MULTISPECIES: site-2 protease family protein [Halobacterium]MCF2239629.1 site-2 protease family protein [Halobacterium salinarum]MDL0137180.1 site-2 protease family protein [Halobacterium salinarum]MDL0139829.1 site-2 protease family protein [Halobacterium salinarum]QRY22240.1 site-2 protease family protein [Halobacterium sp. GSL-19]WJK63612.1 site-2 protease family protein [Halobacterium salinarum]
MPPESPADAPSPAAFGDRFDVYDVQHRDDELLYFGQPGADRATIERELWPLFREHGYDVRLTDRTGERVLVATPADAADTDTGVPWTNVALFLATLASTLFVGANWYYVDPFSPAVVRAIPFTLAVMGVLGTHELGHYVMSKHHDVDATLPYFIPFPSLFGTMGAVIRMRGRMPSRNALFDIGAAGPLAGLVAAVVVSVIGLVLPPVTVPPGVANSASAVHVDFGYPLLLRGIAAVLGEQFAYADPRTAVNPVVMGGWIGMFVTFLNLLPVGQLDGGHILRSLVGETAGRFAPLVPTALLSLGAYLWIVRDAGNAAGIWLLWGVLASVVSLSGTVTPVDDRPLDRRRVALGVVTFVLGALCFMPVPIQLG